MSGSLDIRRSPSDVYDPPQTCLVLVGRPRDKFTLMTPNHVYRKHRVIRIMAFRCQYKGEPR